jgi:hypothetical protein
VNGLADAGAGRLNAGEADGFQKAISYGREISIKNGKDKKNHQPRLRVVAWVVLNY